MSVYALSAAKTVCELREWTASNLEVQKILYLAHLLQLGRTHNPLIVESFEAWDYGPVVPEVYHKAKGFGSGPVRNVFHWVPTISEALPEYQVLKEVADGTRSLTPGQLVAITHRDNGAWSQYYTPGIRGIKIPNNAILNEYNNWDDVD